MNHSTLVSTTTLESLYDEYAALINGNLSAMISDNEAVEGLLCTIVTELWSGREDLMPDKVKTFVITRCQHHVRNHWKKNAVHPDQMLLLDLCKDWTETTPGECTEKIITMIYHKGFTLDQITQAIGTDRNTVLKLIRQHLQELKP